MDRPRQEEVYLQLVGDEHDGLVVELPLDGAVEDVVGHVGIEGAERVVQDVNVPVAVKGAGQTDSLALPSTQVGSTFPDLIGWKHKCRQTDDMFTPRSNRLNMEIGSVTSVRSALGSRARSGRRQQALSTD